MAKQLVDIGQAPNDGTGDPLRVGMDKLNDNINEIYNALGDGTTLADIVNTARELDTFGLANKISFLYNDLVDLQAVNAALYEGCIGFVTEKGALYYAHDGAWNKLLTVNDGAGITDYIDPLAKYAYANNVTNSETSGYVLQSNGDDTYTWVSAPTGGGGTGGSANTFGTIAVSGQPDVKADSTTDTLTLIAGSNVTITTDAVNDSITINAASGSGGSGTDLNSLTGAVIDVAADSFGFIDADDSNNSKKETIADFITAIAGTGLTATNGVLAASGGSGGLPTRSTVTGTTSSIADGASADLNITGYKSYSLYTITTDKAAWVRIYANNASRSSDSSRAETSDPLPDAGVIAEVITTGAETVLVSPGVVGYNLESTPTTTIPCAVKNKSGSTGTVQVTLNVLQLEAD